MTRDKMTKKTLIRISERAPTWIQVVGSMDLNAVLSLELEFIVLSATMSGNHAVAFDFRGAGCCSAMFFF